MKYLFLSPFSLDGSGYKSIVEQLAYGLIERGHEVSILGIGYDKREHDFPFKLVPLEHSWSVEALRVLPERWGVDRVIIANDVPFLVDVVKKFLLEKMVPHIQLIEAIFPIESHPIRPEWAFGLSHFKHRFAISDYGHKVCEKTGLAPTYHLPMGSIVGNPPTLKEGPREYLGWPEDYTIFFMVAANHERKSIPLAMQAFAMLPKETRFLIVTNPVSRLGWTLNDLAEEYGIKDRFEIIPMGVPDGMLSVMYWAADALIVPSQAEGACLPIYEAAQCGLPVICGTWTAMQDVADEPWTLPIKHDYAYRYPWGNVWRFFASVEDLYRRMMEVHVGSVPLHKMSQQAIEFSKGRPWSYAVDVLEQVHEQETEEPAEEEVQS